MLCLVTWKALFGNFLGACFDLREFQIERSGEQLRIIRSCMVNLGQGLEGKGGVWLRGKLCLEASLGACSES